MRVRVRVKVRVRERVRVRVRGRVRVRVRVSAHLDDHARLAHVPRAADDLDVVSHLEPLDQELGLEGERLLELVVLG